MSRISSEKEKKTDRPTKTNRRSSTTKKKIIDSEKNIGVDTLDDNNAGNTESTSEGSSKVTQSSKEQIIETIHVKGHQLVATIKNLFRKGHARRLLLKDASGTIILNIPMTVSLVAVVLGPILAIVATVASFFAKYTIEVIDTSNDDTSQDKKNGDSSTKPTEVTGESIDEDFEE